MSVGMQDMIDSVKELDYLEKEKEKVADSLSELNGKIRILEAKILTHLQDLKQTKFVVEGIGTASIKRRTSVTTPKTIGEKQALWKYIESKHGLDAAWNKFSVNSQSLNSFFNEELNAVQDAVDRQLFQIPGVGAPQVFLTVGLTRR